MNDKKLVSRIYAMTESRGRIKSTQTEAFEINNGNVRMARFGRGNRRRYTKQLSP